MATAQDLFNKVDWEGDEGIKWFKPEDFDDPKLSELLDLALGSYADFEDDFRSLMDYVDTVLEEENEVSNPDS